MNQNVVTVLDLWSPLGVKNSGKVGFFDLCDTYKVFLDSFEHFLFLYHPSLVKGRSPTLTGDMGQNGLLRGSQRGSKMAKSGKMPKKWPGCVGNGAKLF